MTRPRFVLEGEWTGYSSSQRRVVHRTVTRNPARYEHLHYITYTDGTGLVLRLRQCFAREVVKEIHGYDSLIESCLRHGVTRVDQLPEQGRS